MNGVFRWCFVLLFVLENYDWVDSASKSGPYKSIPVRVETCSQTALRLDKEPPVTVAISIYNTSTKDGLLRGDIDVVRDNWMLKLRLKSYIWTNGKWKLTYLINNVGCNGVLLDMFLKLMNMPFNKDKCTMEKGHYHFEDFDVDVVNHLMMSRSEYGKTLWRSELLSPSSTYFCLEFEIVTMPLSA